MAVAPNDEPRSLEAFKQAVSASMKGTPQRMQMSAMNANAKPQKSVWTTVAENKLLVMLALAGIAIAAWQVMRK
jgi:hypothetical protein